VTPLSTGSVSSSGRSLQGTPLDDFGRARLVGVAPVPPTGDRLVDALLGLPAPATAELVADLDVEGGLPTCPGEPPADPQVRLEVGPRSALSIGRFGPFAYDGGSDPLTVPLTSADGRLRFELDPAAVTVPPARPVPWLGSVRVRIVPRRLSGELDPCTDEVQLWFEASFGASVFGVSSRSVRVATVLGTATVSTRGRTLIGARRDGFGAARLVGVADVAPTGDVLLDAFLGLPAPAAAELDIHLEVLGADCPA
jgi:hypothetical protein